jgi:hypothetical protein
MATNMTFTATLPQSFLTTAGQDIDLFPVPSSELTVAQAAIILDVSEGYIDELFDDNLFKYRLEGNQYLIDSDSFIEYKKRRERRRTECKELLGMFQEMGLSYD